MNTKVAVIEDNLPSQKILNKVLNQMNLDVKTIAEGHRAIEYLTHDNPYIILLDMNLPEVNGNEILKFIRRQPHLTNSIVIIISADNAMSSANDDIADFIFMKPIDTRALRTLIQRLCAPSQQE